MAPKIVLTYFDCKGRAEPTRLALRIGDIPFEDKRLDSQEFDSSKLSFPFGQLPVLQVDGEIISQSIAILTYAGKLAGLLPKDPLQEAMVFQILGAVEDMTVKFFPFFMETDEAKKTKLGKEFCDETLKPFLPRLDKVIALGGKNGYCVGDSLTIADLHVYALVGPVINGDIEDIPETVADGCSHLLKVIENVESHPKVQEWNDLQTQ